jgi:hypothetical protein
MVKDPLLQFARGDSQDGTAYWAGTTRDSIARHWTDDVSQFNPNNAVSTNDTTKHKTMTAKMFITPLPVQKHCDSHAHTGQIYFLTKERDFRGHFDFNFDVMTRKQLRVIPS